MKRQNIILPPSKKILNSIRRSAAVSTQCFLVRLRCTPAAYFVGVVLVGFRPGLFRSDFFVSPTICASFESRPNWATI